VIISTDRMINGLMILGVLITMLNAMPNAMPNEPMLKDDVAAPRETAVVQPTVAFMHCMDLIDEFLDDINISFETYCNEFIGSWVFGYINALQRVGVRPILFCITTHVTAPTRLIHQPTGTPICALPAPKPYLAYRAVRRKLLRTYGGGAGQSFRDIADTNPTRRALLTPVKNIAKSLGTYLATPLNVLADELRRDDCQAILCQEYEYARFDTCVLLGKLIGIPVFATFQGGNELQSPLEYPFRRWAFDNCAGVIISTQKEIERVQANYHLSSEKIFQIFDPMDTHTWQAIDREVARTALGIPTAARVVVCHGRIEYHRKGLDILTTAWAEICRERPEVDLRLILVGTGSSGDNAKLREQIQQQQLRGVTWINEFVHDRAIIRQYLSAADIYTMTSRNEGFPIAPIEAMSCGLPVVSTDAPGIPDLLAMGEASGGIMIPRDDVAALVVALGHLLDDRAKAQTLGKAARQRIEDNFSPEAIGQQLRDCLLTSTIAA
jgi:glycosyltransferase involved in cell wall biosynthesis